MSDAKEKDNFKWTEEQTEKVQEWLESKWGKDKPCPFCAGTDWIIGDAPAHLPVGSRDRATILGKLYPFVVVICTTCGTAQLVHSEIAGIQAQQKAKEANNG
jgi:hypothetical protein